MVVPCDEASCPEWRRFCAEVRAGGERCSECREDEDCPEEHPFCEVGIRHRYCTDCRTDEDCPAGAECAYPECLDECRLQCWVPPPPPDPCRQAGREAGECERECEAAAVVDRLLFTQARDAQMVWNGRHLGIVYPHEAEEGPRLRFALVALDGEVLTEPVDLLDRRTSTVVIAWTGAEYGVAWADDRFDEVGGARNVEVYFRRISRAGELLGDEVRVSDAPGWTWPGGLVWSGAAYGLLLTQRYEDGPNRAVHFARLDAQGRRLGEVVRLDDSESGIYASALGWGGERFAAAWRQGSGTSSWNIHVRLVSAEGEALGEPVQLSRTRRQSENPSIAWSGEAFGVAWNDHAGEGAGVFFRRVRADGSVDGDVQQIADAEFSGRPSFLAWTGVDFSLAWSTIPRLYFTHLTAAGERRGTDAWLAVPGDQIQAHGRQVLWAGDRFAAIYNRADDLHLLTGPMTCPD